MLRHLGCSEEVLAVADDFRVLLEQGGGQCPGEGWKGMHLVSQILYPQ